MNNWQKVRLGDLCSVKHGYAFKGEFFTEIPNSVILLTPGNFAIGGGFKSDKLKFYNGEIPKDYILKPNDIVITMTDLSKAGDTLGYSAKIPDNKNIYLHNQRIGLVEFNSQEVCKDFIYWLLRSYTYQRYVVGSATGSTVKHTSPKLIQAFEFLLPPPLEQERIAGILGALDDKIELNNRINRNLEEQALGLFRRWFVDFEFPDQNGNPYRTNGGEMIDSTLGEIPKGWKIGKLSDFILVKYGKDHKMLKDGDIPVYGSGGIMRYAESFLYNKESVLIPRKGTLNNVFYINTPFWSVDTMFYSEMKYNHIAKFVYFFLKAKDLASMNAGSAVPSMTTEILNQLSMPIATKDIFSKYDSITTTFFNQIENNQKEIQTLAAFRDALLPRLMSEEVKV